MMTKFRFEDHQSLAAPTGARVMYSMSFGARPGKRELKGRGQIRRLAGDVSLEHTWSEINQHRLSDVPQATVEALVFSLRDGIAALGRSATWRRLSELSPAQLREVAVRVQKFKPEIAQPWTSNEVEVLIIARSRVNA
jgi:hypothetical protein